MSPMLMRPSFQSCRPKGSFRPPGTSSTVQRFEGPQRTTKTACSLSLAFFSLR